LIKGADMRVAFKTTKQKTGKINGVKVHKSRTGEFGILLCEDEEEANKKIRCLNLYKKGMIVEMLDTEGLSNNEIMTHPTVNPSEFRGQKQHPLWKYFTIDELGQLNNLADEC
jgi:hypothetical protein